MPHKFEYVGGAALYWHHEEDRWRLYHEACAPDDGGWYMEIKDGVVHGPVDNPIPNVCPECSEPICMQPTT